MPTEPHPLTTAEVVHRAVETCEAGEVDERLGDLLPRFEDADEPIRSIEDVELLRDEVLGTIDPDWESSTLARSSSLVMARAVAVCLRFRRDEIDSDGTRLLRLAARAEFHGVPPPAVLARLRGTGVKM
jgi:hypothetical protein